MKWAALAIALVAIIPLASWLRQNPLQAPKAWMLMGFLPFAVQTFHLYMAIISWPQWAGHTKGIEISILDILAFALYLSLPRRGPAIPFRFSMTLYFLAVLLSAFQSPVPIASLFYLWQLARMFLVYAVVAKATSDERVVPSLFTGMTLGLCFEASEALWERFGLGVLQTGGSLGHQNLLGLMSHFVVFPWFALLLAGQRGWRPVLGPLVGLTVEVLTVSRATIGLAGIGYSGLFILSSLRGWTRRKALILAASAAVVLLLTPVVMSSFEDRFSDQTVTHYDERAALEKAADMMISDHPYGVGANYYVVTANVGGYNSRAGVAPTLGSDSTNVHNIYYLVTAETGYIGLVAFVIMLLQLPIAAFRCSWRSRGDPRGDLLLGLGVALSIVYIHSYFEWILITFTPQYMLAFDAGAVAGLATQLGYWQRSQAASRPAVLSQVAPIAKETLK